MALLKTEQEKDIARTAGKRLAQILETLRKEIVPGVSTLSLDKKAEELIRKGGDEPAFLGYQPEGADFPYPNSLCVSVNDEVVHGIPGERELKEGDIVGIDLGLSHKGFIVDAALSVPCGVISKEHADLLSDTKKALMLGIAEVKHGAFTGDVGFAISSFGKKKKYGIVDDLGGHGVGNSVHEEPYVPNTGKKGHGDMLKEGDVIAIEPMFTLGKKDVTLSSDGYTFKTRDGSMCAHFEHTVLVGKNGPEILTEL